MAQTVRERQEIPERYRWDTESIFATVTDWETAVTQIQAQLKELKKYNGRLAEGPAILADFLEASEAMQRQLRHVFIYAFLNYSVNTTDQAWAARADRARSLSSQVQATLAFAEPEMLAAGLPTLRQWLAAEPRLAHYAHYLDQLEQKQAHVRPAEVEELLGMVQDPLQTAITTHSILANADLTFKPAVDSKGETYEISQGTIGQLLTHADRKLRRTAWEHYADAHLALKNSMANNLSAGVKRDVFLARARRYQDSLDAALSANFIPATVFTNLIETYKKNLPTWHRYWEIRRRALGLEKLHLYDVKAPLTPNAPQIPYETAVAWIAAGMRPLGDEYAETLRRGALEERWVDVYPNKGKRMGAFSSGAPGAHPFIMMSYSDDLFGLSTLAHELGHSMHSWYTWQNQPFIYSRYSLFVAEVASNFNQAMVRAHLLAEQNDPDFQIAVLEEAMANFHRYFFIMPTLARFELEIHRRVERGEALNASTLTNLMADLFSEGFGEGVEIDRERLGITWAQFHTHLYSNFYVYQYATGISAAHALAQKVLDGRPQAAENYLAFLKAGSSLYPLDALKLAGVDMNSPEPVETTFAILAEYVTRLETLAASQQTAAPA